MRTIIGAIFVALFVVVLGGLALIYSGLYDVGATEPDWVVTRWVLETARTRSIKTHAVGIAVPATLSDPRNLVIGTEHFAAHCAVCHGAPGVPRGDIAHGFYRSQPILRTPPISPRLVSCSGF